MNHTLRDSPLLSQGPPLESDTFSRDPVSPGTKKKYMQAIIITMSLTTMQWYLVVVQKAIYIVKQTPRKSKVSVLVLTGPKLRFPYVVAYQNMTFPTLVCQRIGQNFVKCVEILPYPTHFLHA